MFLLANKLLYLRDERFMAALSSVLFQVCRSAIYHSPHS